MKMCVVYPSKSPAAGTNTKPVIIASFDVELAADEKKKKKKKDMFFFLLLETNVL